MPCVDPFIECYIFSSNWVRAIFKNNSLVDVRMMKVLPWKWQLSIPGQQFSAEIYLKSCCLGSLGNNVWQFSDQLSQCDLCQRAMSGWSLPCRWTIFVFYYANAISCKTAKSGCIFLKCDLVSLTNDRREISHALANHLFQKDTYRLKYHYKSAKR
jgi:hypothetical protein